MLVSISRLFRTLLLAQCAWFLVACGGGGGGEALPVLPPVPVAPAISTQPSAVAVTTGQAATFSVTATGTTPQYQWHRNGANVAGATQASYTLPAAALVDNGAQFTVTVSNTSGNVTSQPATLTVTDPAIAPSFVRAPVTLSVIAGETATFDLVAAGTAPLSYQWFRGGVAIVGAVQASYSLVTTLADNDVQITARVSNSAGSVTSAVANLRVSAQFVPVSIATQPLDVTVRAGENATISVLLGGTGPFTWAWFRDGVNLGLGVSGTFVNTPSFVFTPAVLADNGALISLQVTDPSGTVTTRQARLTVSP